MRLLTASTQLVVRAALLVVFWTSTALPDPPSRSVSHLTVTFAADEAPGGVCFLTRNEGALPLSDVPTVPDAGGDWAPAAIEDDQLRQLGDRVRGRALCNMKDPRRKAECEKLRREMAKGIGGVLQALRQRAVSPVDAETCQIRCAPSVALPTLTAETRSKWFLSCAHDSGSGAGVVVVKLEAPPIFAGKRPAVGVKSVQLEGTVASVELTGSLDDGAYVVAMVVGGTYLDSKQTALSSESGQIRLKLEPRCTTEAVQLRELTGEVEVRLSGDNDGCSGHQTTSVTGGLLRVRVPHVPDRYTLVVSARSAKPVREYSASWSPAHGPPDFQLRRTAISFEWKIDCRYPVLPGSTLTACPKARLRASGTACDDGVRRERSCHYTCRAAEGSGIDLPTVVHFDGTTGANETWTAILSHTGEALTDYVAPEYRKVRVRPWQWPDDEEATVRLRTTTGQVHPLGSRLSEPVYIPLASTGCNDALKLEVEGSRFYESPAVDVDQGELVLPEARALARRWSLGVAAHAGEGFVVSEDHEWIDTPWGYLGGVLSFDPWSDPWQFEARLGIDVSQRKYLSRFDFSNGIEQEESADGRAWYRRFPLVEALAAYQVAAGLAVGPMLGVSWGHPMTTGDRDVVGGFDFAVSGAVVGQLDLSRALGLELIVRGLWGEELYRYDTDLTGGVERTNVEPDDWVVPTFVLVGLGVRVRAVPL